MTTTPALVHNGKDDDLTEEGLANIFELLDRLPEEFDVSSMQASTASVSVTFRFPVRGPEAQLATIEGLIQAALCTGTLARNLRHARTQLADRVGS